MRDTVPGSEEGTILNDEAVSSVSIAEEDELSPIQLYGLGLLERVVAVRQTYQDDPSKDAWLMNAINRAVYAAYLDCIDEGVGENAKALLRQGPEQ
jgi:hypothetical protein